MKNSGVVSLTNLILQSHTTHPMDSKYFRIMILFDTIEDLFVNENK